MRDLTGQQIRQLTDTKQAYQALLQVETEAAHNFRGAMSWKRIHGRDYLYRKRRGEWKSLGLRSPDTEKMYDRFHEGRAAARERAEHLKAEIETMAPICLAMGLGRMPFLSARILRRLGAEGVLGRGLSVVGTHAMFAYESLVSAHFASEHIATADIDLLFDAGASLKLMAPELKEGGLIGLLRRVDRSFDAAPGAFRAANDRGFLVDLIMPQPKNPAQAPARRRIGNSADDQAAAEIEGLNWLENSARIEEIAIDEKGFPVRVIAPDPRAFAVHKAWVSSRPDREPGKRRRDIRQANAVARMIGKYLPHLRFDDQALQAFPADVRAEALSLIDREASFSPVPDWEG